MRIKKIQFYLSILPSGSEQISSINVTLNKTAKADEDPTILYEWNSE